MPRNIAWDAYLVVRGEYWFSGTQHCRTGRDKARRRGTGLRDNWHVSTSRLPTWPRHIADYSNCHRPAASWGRKPVRIIDRRGHRVPVRIPRLHHHQRNRTAGRFTCQESENKDRRTDLQLERAVSTASGKAHHVSSLCSWCSKC